MRKFNFELDAIGLWTAAIGIWFHIMARLVRKEPDMAIQLGEFIAVVLVLWGGYRMLNHLGDSWRKKEKKENADAQDKE